MVYAAKYVPIAVVGALHVGAEQVLVSHLEAEALDNGLFEDVLVYMSEWRCIIHLHTASFWKAVLTN